MPWRLRQWGMCRVSEMLPNGSTACPFGMVHQEMSCQESCCEPSPTGAAPPPRQRRRWGRWWSWWLP
jgi:hypothetical protein